MTVSRQMIFVVSLAFLYATYCAYVTHPSDSRLMEVDGWAEKIRLTAPDRLTFDDVTSSPSLWKGPIVPTIYHFTYFVLPSVYTVLGVNAFAFALSAGILYRLLVKHSQNPVSSLLAIGLWIAYIPHQILFGYYFSEPLITLFSVIALSLVMSPVNRPMTTGAALGFLLLARPTFLVVALTVPVMKWLTDDGSRRERNIWAVRYFVGFLTVFLPWGLRNLLVVGAFVPFTVEGGQTLFHGSYLPIEEDRWQVLKEQPGVRELVAAAPTDPVERMHYFSGLAREQVLADPLGQAVRCVRKAMKFWVNLEPGEWIPGWKTAVTSGICLILGTFSAIRYRYLPIVRWTTVWVLGLWMLHAVVFGLIRYNFPVLPLLFFLAASAIFPPNRTKASSHEFGSPDALPDPGTPTAD